MWYAPQIKWLVTIWNTKQGCHRGEFLSGLWEQIVCWAFSVFMNSFQSMYWVIKLVFTVDSRIFLVETSFPSSQYPSIIKSFSRKFAKYMMCITWCVLRLSLATLKPGLKNWAWFFFQQKYTLRGWREMGYYRIHSMKIFINLMHSLRYQYKYITIIKKNVSQMSKMSLTRSAIQFP